MSRLTLRLPETLHQQLVQLAECEGVSLNQYIVYALTRQTTADYSVHAVPLANVQQQHEAFEAMVNRLGSSSQAQLRSTLSQREEVKPEEDLSPEIIALMQKRIRNVTDA